MARPKVILARCDSYDVAKIEGIVLRGLEEMELHPTGRTIVKPNLVIAHDKYFRHAYTRPEFTEGVIRAARQRAQDLQSIRVAERCGITIPTRMVFREAGYRKMARRAGVELVPLEEVPQVEFTLRHPDRLRDYLFTPEPIATCDFMINVPKFKAHPWTTVTFALKNWIGIQDDRHRMLDHDYHLDHKIADLQEIVQPRFIAIDAIVAGQDRMLTAVPYDLKLVIMGNNAVATDAVCCHILGLDPAAIDHIRLCHERGLGPLSLGEIDLSGDVSLEQAQRDAAAFRKGLIRVEDYFKGSRITGYAGPPGRDTHCEYCWGGCPGAMEEAIEIIRTTDPKVDQSMKPLHVVFGRYQGPIEAGPGEKVLFIGDCTSWSGTLGGRQISVSNEYVEQSTKDPHQARFFDLLLKMLLVFINVFRRRRDPYIKVKGCPVSVAEQVLYISRAAKTRNPYLDPIIVLPFFLAYLANRTATFFRRLVGVPYQRRHRPPDRARADQSTRKPL